MYGTSLNPFLVSLFFSFFLLLLVIAFTSLITGWVWHRDTWTNIILINIGMIIQIIPI